MDKERFHESYRDDEDLEGLILEIVEYSEVAGVEETKKALIDRRFKNDMSQYAKEIHNKITVMVDQGKLQAAQNFRLKLPKESKEQG